MHCIGCKMNALLALLPFVAAFAAIVNADSTISVQIGSSATVIGYQQANPDGFVFYGIPYAQPPIGQLRFAPTQRKDPSGRILAFHFGSACVQEGAGNFDEDCLFLNIWTPKMNNITANKYPVLFFVHGGGFVDGSGNLYSEGILKNLVSRGIIVVSINYRLGPFGFFSTRDSTLPGNMGILDQIEALNWVKRYVSYFGGDPNAVTIDGQSAGAESISFLTLSPLTKGLFKQAIIESGTAFSPGAISYSDSQTDACKQAAIEFGCITADQWDNRNSTLMAQMLQCLRSISVSEIQTAWGGWDGLHRWAPVGDNYVFPDHVENLVLKRGPMPLLIGNCKDEQLLRYMDQLQQDPHFLNEWTRQSTAQHFSSLFELKFYNNSALVRQQGLDAYVNSLPYADQDHVSWVLDSIQLDSEMIFIGPTYREAMNFRHVGSPVYLYSFDYLAPGAMPLLNASFRGVPHTWELQYLFGFPGTSEGGWQVTSDDIATMNNFGLYWANFVNYGNPTPASSATIWPQLGTNGEYMIIGPAPRPATNFHPKAATFWACTVPTTEGYRPAWCP